MFIRGLEKYNPITVFVFYISVTVITMLWLNPVTAGISLLGAVTYFGVCSRSITGNWAGGAKGHLGFVALFLLIALINPLFSHNGVTVLFVLNGRPITLEAFLYGIVYACGACAVVYWFRSFTKIMTSDKLLYLFSRFSPKVGLVFSMALRYVPLFAKQADKIRNSQKGMGLYKEGKAIDSCKNNIRVFSILTTWGIENSIITADSMAARGYGNGKRSLFSLFFYTGADGIVTAFIFFVSAFLFTAFAIGEGRCTFYPEFILDHSKMTFVMYILYGILVFMPSLLTLGEELKWKYLTSKI